MMLLTLAQQQAAETAAPQAQPKGDWFQRLSDWWSGVAENHAYSMQNALTLLIVGTLVALLIGASRQAHWRRAIRATFATKRASIAFIVLCAYLTLGLLDSISWRDAQLGADGKPLIADDGEVVLQARGLSLLDRLDRATLQLSTLDEKSFSAPYADKAFSPVITRGEDGSRERTYPPLNHPGKHPMGTDQVGRDVLYKAVKGIHTALVIGGFTTLIAIPFALLLGVTAGYFGGVVDEAITFFYSTLASIPWVLLVIAFVLTFGTGLPQLVIVLGLTSWVSLCRLVRGETLKLRESDFVLAARSQGASAWRIQTKHILPNVMHLVIIRAVLMFSGLVLAEAVLSYLGVGVGPDTHSWGAMINQGRFELSRDPVIWWNLTAAFIFMFGLVLPVNVFGDALRDALDPRLQSGT